MIEMARIPRILNSGEPTVYHLMSRTALDGFPLGDVEKDYFVQLVRKFSRIYFVEVLGFCCMGNHFHLLVRMCPDSDFSDDDIRERFHRCYGLFRKLMDGQVPHYREKWSSLSKFMQEVKVGFSRFYNKRHDRQGYFWGERFKSVIVQSGEALLNCLAYIDLNPVRAGLVEKPEDYRWSSIGWHVQTGNRGHFLSLDFGMPEYGNLKFSERFQQYRRFLYETGAIDRGKGAVLKEEIIEEEKKTNFEITRIDRFRYRTRYFTDSGIIGSKDFVHRVYNNVRDRFPTKRDKIPNPIKGLDGIYSLKKFTEDR